MNDEPADGRNESIRKVPVNARPISEQDAYRRAHFFASAMFSNCTILLEDVLNTSQTPVDLEDARFKESLKSAAKELTCISMYLAFLDQGEMATEKWLADWQIVAMRQVEEMVAQPSCRVVLQKYAAKFADAMMREGAVEVCRMLHIAEHSDILLDALRAKRNYRNELIFMALTHSIDELRQHMVLFSQF